MHRPTIGLIALILLVIGLLPIGSVDASLRGSTLRVGLVMGILWLAQPQLGRVPRWAIVGGGCALFVVLRWPKMLVLLLPVAAVLWLLRPRNRDRRGNAG